jgi:anti-sigma regulatory factor (Ser/Thr protein kinase)
MTAQCSCDCIDAPGIDALGGPAGTRQPNQPRAAQPSAIGLVTAQPTVTCALRPLPESVRIGRDFTRATLLKWGMSAQIDLAELVISELLTNALRHGVPSARQLSDDCPIRLKLLDQTPYLMCLVTDPGIAVPVLRESGLFTESGRGLKVVESCCVRWGWHSVDGGGKVVWALLHPDP